MVLYRLKLNRCMMIGTKMANRPKSRSGLEKAIMCYFYKAANIQKKYAVGVLL